MKISWWNIFAQLIYSKRAKTKTVPRGRHILFMNDRPLHLQNSILGNKKTGKNSPALLRMGAFATKKCPVRVTTSHNLLNACLHSLMNNLKRVPVSYGEIIRSFCLGKFYTDLSHSLQGLGLLSPQSPVHLSNHDSRKWLFRHSKHQLECVCVCKMGAIKSPGGNVWFLNPFRLL
jgi:hypothetical protein